MYGYGHVKNKMDLRILIGPHGFGYLVAESDAVEKEVVLLAGVVRVDIVRVGPALHQERRHLLEIAL